MVPSELVEQMRAEVVVVSRETSRTVALRVLAMAVPVAVYLSPLPFTGLTQAFAVTVAALVSASLFFTLPHLVALTAVRTGSEGNRDTVAKWVTASLLSGLWAITFYLATGSVLTTAALTAGIAPVAAFMSATLIRVTVDEWRRVAARLILAGRGLPDENPAQFSYDDEDAARPV